MARVRLLAGNWKMYKTRAEAAEFAAQLGQLTRDAASATVGGFPELLICAPATALLGLLEPLQASHAGLGAQNMHEAAQGAFTGEVAAAMLKEVGCSYVILGHSERRMYFTESDDAVAKKTVVALDHQLTPIVCVGESLAEREQGDTFQKISAQVGAVLGALRAQPQGAEKLVIAYEPIWAIGTGRTASRADAQEAAAAIRKLVREQLGDQVADGVRILYGGSVKPENIADFLDEADIDGALVGGASLEADSFFRMAANSALPR